MSQPRDDPQPGGSSDGRIPGARLDQGHTGHLSVERTQTASGLVRVSLRKLTVGVVARDLAETAEITGFNTPTTLVRAIRVFAELVKVDRAGGEIIIKEADGSQSRLLLR